MNPIIDTIEKEVMKSEPVRLLIEIHTTAIVTGHAPQYDGILLPDVIRSALTRAYEAGLKESERLPAYTVGWNGGRLDTLKEVGEKMDSKIEDNDKEGETLDTLIMNEDWNKISQGWGHLITQKNGELHFAKQRIKDICNENSALSSLKSWVEQEIDDIKK